MDQQGNRIQEVLALRTLKVGSHNKEKSLKRERCVRRLARVVEARFALIVLVFVASFLKGCAIPD